MNERINQPNLETLNVLFCFNIIQHTTSPADITTGPSHISEINLELHCDSKGKKQLKDVIQNPIGITYLKIFFKVGLNNYQNVCILTITNIS